MKERRKHPSRARANRNRAIDLQKYQRTGFIGEARFALHPSLPENYKQALHLLAKFAFFSGVGSHTTMGMGQVVQAANRKGQEARGANRMEQDCLGF